MQVVLPAGPLLTFTCCTVSLPSVLKGNKRLRRSVVRDVAFKIDTFFKGHLILDTCFLCHVTQMFCSRRYSVHSFTRSSDVQVCSHKYHTPLTLKTAASSFRGIQTLLLTLRRLMSYIYIWSTHS